MTESQKFQGRSPEELTLMNPAFCAAVLYYSIAEYEAEAGDGMPFALAFLVLPLVLVKSSRSSLPRKKNSSLAAWLQEHPDERLHYPNVTSALVPVVRESLLFASSKNVLAIDGKLIRSTSKLVRGAGKLVSTNTAEVKEIFNKAKFVGRWFANAGSVQTIFALWGVRP